MSFRNATATREPSPAALARPRIAEDVTVHTPDKEGAPWVIQRGRHQYFRVQADLARLARTVDGTRDHAGLAEILGPPWTPDVVGLAVRKLADSRLLDDGGTGRKRKERGTWIRFVPPLTLQFTILKPERVLRRLTPLIRALAHRTAAVGAAVAVLGGLLALAAQGSELHSALSQPLPLTVYLAVACAMLATTCVHEMGHGAVLTYYGGRPSRMGVMLFYLSPAFFCDVSDGWRLPDKAHRVRVALAGITTQAVIAGGTGIATLFVDDASVHAGLLVFTVSTYVSGLLNLLPFIKLDGYIALMSHLDLPHLRDRAMTDGRRFVAKVLFGGRYSRELPQLPWSVIYGLACLAFPFYIVTSAMRLWADTVQRLGPIGASLVLFGIGYFLYHLGRGFKRLLSEARAAGARTWRMCAATLLTLAAVSALLLWVRLPYAVSGGYVRNSGSELNLVLPSSADRSVITKGTTVELFRSGLAAKVKTGTAVVADAQGKNTTAPLSAFLPVQTDGLPQLVVGYRLTGADIPVDRVGTAVVNAGELPLWNWLYSKYVAPAWRW
ncbi:daptide biosynthesis intramembrane metalloprotease [Streptomyces chrestomyceticus]|uniref:daptide biosynthesis intramembrane metalloprotease n=2 Tax=Streptomyces chrestomyceticus TaxID=68185 RepID=UPI0033FC968B